MGKGLWISWIRLGDAFPDQLSLGILALPLKLERLRTRIPLSEDKNVSEGDKNKQECATPKSGKHLIFSLSSLLPSAYAPECAASHDSHGTRQKRGGVTPPRP